MSHLSDLSLAALPPQERLRALQNDAEECQRLRQECGRLRGANEVMRGQLDDREHEVANLQVALGQLNAEVRSAALQCVALSHHLQSRLAARRAMQSNSVRVAPAS